MDQAVAAIVAVPEIGAVKRGDLAGVDVHKFDCVGQRFLLAYEWDSRQRILRALGVQENFDRDRDRKRGQ